MSGDHGDDAARRVSVVGARLRTPRAAAIAGIIFSVLLISSLWLLWTSVPADPREVASWLTSGRQRASLALNLVPFAGIAFLWFLGVLRDRLGEREDRFFATVFLGSGLMFLGMVFVAASAMGALLLTHSASSIDWLDNPTPMFVRAFTYDLIHIYAFKLAAVFMMTSSTLVLRTRIATRAIAWLGYGAAIFIIVGSNFFDWALFLFPSWILLLSVNILIDNFFGSPKAESAA